MATGSTGSKRSGSAEKTSPVPHTRIEDESMIEDMYDMGRKLGQGSFGIVREVTHRESGEIWACKAINKEKAGSSAIKLLEREVAILKRVRHEHIIRLKEVLETSKKMYLVMECCDGGELADVIKEKGTFSEPEVKTIMKRLASAIHYMHKNDMVHRDLKLENILLSNNPSDSSDTLYIKVTDFGLSVVKGGVGHDNMLMDFCGTPMYMAPEIIDNKAYSERCDVWAMGVIMYILLFGSPPFQSKDEEQLYDMIKSLDISKCIEKEKLSQQITDEAKDCLCCMLHKDPAHRLTAHQVLDHPWVTGHDSGQPLNALDLMTKWRNELTNDSEETTNGAINGTQSLSSPSSSDSVSPEKTRSSGKNSKDGAIRRTAQDQSRKNLPLARISTDPTLSGLSSQRGVPKHSAVDRTSSQSHRAKSKSPTEKDISSRNTSRLSTGNSSHQTPRTSTTRPLNGALKTSSSNDPRNVKKKSR